MTTVPNFLNFTINAVLRPTFIRKLYYKLSSILTFTFVQIFDQNFVFFRPTEWRQSCRVCLIQCQNSRYFRFPVLKTKSLLKSKPMWKLKHANSILETFEYFWQISSKLILVIFSYTVSKLVRFFETQCKYTDRVAVLWQHIDKICAVHTQTRLHLHKHRAISQQ